MYDKEIMKTRSCTSYELFIKWSKYIYINVYIYFSRVVKIDQDNRY